MFRKPPIPWSILLGLCGLLPVFACARTRTTNTARTGIEQVLVSNAIDQTLDRTPLPPVAGKKVFLEEKYLDCVDKGYLVASLRHRLLQEGALLTPTSEGSEITVEVRSGGIGTDDSDRFIGMPGLTVPGILPIELPEVRVYEQFSQYGTAKLGLVAYETVSGQLVFDSGRRLARSDDSRWSVLGLGPFQSGTARQEISSSTPDSTLRTATKDTPLR